MICKHCGHEFNFLCLALCIDNPTMQDITDFFGIEDKGRIGIEEIKDSFMHRFTEAAKERDPNETY